MTTLRRLGLAFVLGASLLGGPTAIASSLYRSTISTAKDTTHKRTHRKLRHRSHRIHRSSSVRHRFMVQTGYPHGRPGYVVDHIVPLACGGVDDPSNMQWQSIAEALAKDKWERVGCQPIR